MTISESCQPERLLGNLPSSDRFAEAMLEVMHRKGVKELHVVKVEAAYYDQMLRSLQQARRADEAVTVVYSAPGDALDFKSVVARLRSKKAKMAAVLFFPGR
jgi:acyl CoA:acetate/3-ketoacid CoA transferase alpha subunit